MTSSHQLPSSVDPKSRITPKLLSENNYKDCTYYARITIRGPKTLGYTDRSIEEHINNDPKYSDWVFDKILVMNWILNSMEEGTAAIFNILTQPRNLRTLLR